MDKWNQALHQSVDQTSSCKYTRTKVFLAAPSGMDRTCVLEHLFAGSVDFGYDYFQPCLFLVLFGMLNSEQV